MSAGERSFTSIGWSTCPGTMSVCSWMWIHRKCISACSQTKAYDLSHDPGRRSIKTDGSAENVISMGKVNGDRACHQHFFEGRYRRCERDNRRSTGTSGECHPFLSGTENPQR